MCGGRGGRRSFQGIDRGEVITNSGGLRLRSIYLILKAVEVIEGILIRKVNDTTLCDFGGGYFSSDFEATLLGQGKTVGREMSYFVALTRSEMIRA